MKLKIYIISLSLLTVMSCKKELSVKNAPDFTVTPDSASYKTGSLVTFNFQGKTDVLSFYSGEVFRDYDFKDGRVVDVNGKGLTLSFKSGIAANIGTQTDQLSILASNNFDGNYSNLASVKEATWTDITSRFALGTSATLAASTEQDISDLLIAGKPLYLAFKYVTSPQAENNLARQWLIEGVTLSSIGALLNEVPVVIANQVNAGFRIIDQEPVNAPSRSQITATRITLYGNVYKDPTDPIYDPNNPIFDPNNPIYDPLSTEYNAAAKLPTYVPYDPSSPYNDPSTENWAVSAPIILDKVDLGPDRASTIRGITSTPLTSFSYRYNAPGTYKAYFIGSNNTIDESKQVVREVTITVTP